jgi:hypothetical protein
LVAKPVLQDGTQVLDIHHAGHVSLLPQVATQSQLQLVMHGQPQAQLGFHALVHHQMLLHAGSHQAVHTSPHYVPLDTIYPLPEHVLQELPSPETALSVDQTDAFYVLLDISYQVPHHALHAQETAQPVSVLQTAQDA